MLHDSDLVSIQEVRTKVDAAYRAWLEYRNFNQERVDAIVERVAHAARGNAERLAVLAVEETGYGNVRDKVWKNLLASDLLARTLRGMKTVGVVRELVEQRITEVAEPMGVVAAVLPTTNPTSTAIYKILIALKAGNAIVLSPHPRAVRCTCETASILAEAAREAGVPEGLIQCVNTPTMEGTQELMRHRRTGVILSTGGSGIVREAYSSGKPAIGVGPGNVPVLIDVSADVAVAVRQVVEGKSFDFGTVCSSEQTVVAERSLRDRILAELKANKAHLCSAEQSEALAKVLIGPRFSINPDCVGQSPGRIARMAGFETPADTSILVVELKGVGREHPLSAEKLSPVLSLYFADSFGAALEACQVVLRFGGLGHTAVIHAQDEARVREFGLRMPAFRVLVNTSSPQGSTGITTGLFPAMTLGCGAWAGNITSDNVGPLHLVNLKRIAWSTRTVEQAFPDSGRMTGAAEFRMQIDRKQIADAVERYLAARGLGSTPASAPAASCGCGGTCSSKTAAAGPAPAPIAAAPPRTVDFVCEEDVRVAQKRGEKIYIGPKTIVTPAARDLAAKQQTLVSTPK